jgi:hypothetical protein
VSTKAAGKAAKSPGKKTTAKKGVKAKAVKKPASDDVSAYMKALDHPLKKDIEAVRKAILAVDSKIAEGVKWYAPSFRVEDYFATVNLRSMDAVQLVFHRGAKVKMDGKKLKIDDPNGLVKWLSDDRCLVTLGAGKTAKANMPAFKAIVAQWVAQL